MTKRFVLPTHIRKNLNDPTLKLVLAKADPHATGIITLDKLNDVLSSMDASEFGATAGSVRARRVRGVRAEQGRHRAGLDSSRHATMRQCERC